MSKRFIATLAGALAIVVLVVGCGGGDDSGDSGSSETSAPAETSAPDNGAPALSKAEFIKQGDAICTETATTLAQGTKEFFGAAGLDESEEPSEEVQEELVGEVFLPAYQTQAEELAALGAPEGEEETVEGIVTGFEEAIADAEGDLGGAISDDPFADVKAEAADFGFTVCST